MTDPTLYRDDSRIFTIRGVQIMLGEVKCCQCDSVATSQVQFPMRESL